MMTEERIPPGDAPWRDPDPIILTRRPLRSAIRYLAQLMEEPRYDFMTDDLWLTVLRGLVEAHEARNDEPDSRHPDTV